MTTTSAPDCVRCKHLHRDPNATANTCAAFPSGIPGAILYEGRKHLKAYPGDHGIRFELESDGRPPLRA